MPMHRRRSLFGLSLLHNEYPTLHGLRVLAALVIVSGHIRPFLFHEITRLWCFMDVYFVMSGFLIGLMLLRSDDLGRAGILRFYVRRSVRTFPLYYVVLTYAVFFLPNPPDAIDNVWREYLYVSNFVNLGEKNFVMFWGWSLCVEEHFYLVCPLLILGLMRLRSTRTQLWILGIASALMPLFRFAVVNGWIVSGSANRHELAYYCSVFRLDEFFIGIAAAILHHRHPEKVRAFFTTRIGTIQAPLVAIALLTFCISMDIDSGNIMSLSFTSAGIAWALLIPYTIYVRNRFTSWLARPSFRYLATLTYGLYLVHLYVARNTVPYWLGGILPNENEFLFAHWLLKLLGTLGFSFLIAYALHLSIEKPLLWLRDHPLTRQKPKRDQDSFPQPAINSRRALL